MRASPALILTKIEDVAQSSWNLYSAVAVASSSATTTCSHQNNVVHAAKIAQIGNNVRVYRPFIVIFYRYSLGGLPNEAMFGTNNQNLLR